MTIRTIQATDEPAPANDSPVLLVDRVQKSFGAGPFWHRRKIQVLTGASLQVSSGEFVGLVGENGSGKSVLMQIIVGMLARDSGAVVTAPKLGYCPQVPMLWDKLTVREHFELFASAYRMDERAALESQDQLLGELQFERYADYRVEHLSGGTRQKLNLSLALMHEPDLLLLDEPYSGFDWETYLRFWDMSQERRSNGMGILVVSHLLAERERLDRIYALEGGRCVEP